MPAKDTGTTSIADTSMITIRPQDSTLWYKYKGIWKSTKSSGGGGTGIDTTAWHKGGDSSLTNNIIGTKANRSLYFILNGTKYARLDSGAQQLEFSSNNFASIAAFLGLSASGLGIAYLGHKVSSPILNSDTAIFFPPDTISSPNNGLDTIGNSKYFIAGKNGHFYMHPNGSIWDRILGMSDTTSTITTVSSLAAALSNYPTTSSVNISLGLKMNLNDSIAGGYYPYSTNPKGYGTGTITGVTAGTNLTGGGTSGNVTLNADTTTGSTKLATQGYVSRSAYTQPSTTTNNYDTVPLMVFGAGSGAAGDTAAFSTTALYGSVYNSGVDTFIVSKMVVGLQGSSPSVTVNVYYGSTLNSGGTALVSGGTSCTNTTTGTVVTSFTNTKIAPNNFIWVQTTSITTKPTYFTLTLIGYKKHV